MNALYIGVITHLIGAAVCCWIGGKLFDIGELPEPVPTPLLVGLLILVWPIAAISTEPPALSDGNGLIIEALAVIEVVALLVAAVTT